MSVELVVAHLSVNKSRTIFADVVGSANDNDDIQVTCSDGKFSTNNKELVGKRSTYDLFYRLSERVDILDRTIAKSFMNKHAISPVPPSNEPGSDFADIEYTFVWEEYFPYTGEYVFRGACDNRGHLFIDDEKVFRLDGFRDAPSKRKKMIEEGVHEISLTLRNKPNQLDSPLSDHFEIISYDQRGLGQTSKPSGSYSMQQYADDAASLLDELHIDTIPVMGVSFGGMVAQEFIKRHPSRVSKLVLACTSSGGDGGSSYPLHELEELNEEEKLDLSIKINDLRITDVWIKQNNDSWNIIKEEARKKRLYSTDPTNLLKQLMARKDHNTFQSLKNIDIPVFLMGGKYDGIAPASNMEAIHKNITDSRLEFYEGGHLFLIQDKKAFRDLVDWLL